MSSHSHDFSELGPTPSSHHECFEQLCALMAIGELSDAEQKDLREHLVSCPRCQELYADFCQIGSDDLGLLAAQHHRDGQTLLQPSENPSDYWSRLQERVEDKPNHAKEAARYGSLRRLPPVSTLPRSIDRFRPIRRKGPWAAAAAAAVFGILAISTWRRYQDATAVAHSSLADTHALQQELEQLQEQQSADANSRASLSEAAQSLQLATESLQHDLSEAHERNAELEKHVVELNRQLATATAKVDESTRDLRQLRTTAEGESQRRTDGENRLQVALQETRRLREERTQALLTAADQDQKIAGLEARLAGESAALERTQRAVAGSGLEGENLFGARNLHIVDVYDVDGEGRTKRTYGRVYYVEKKLLVFYAFDLQAKQRSQLTAGFQAWGYREVGSGKPENLGLFHLDDAAASRWALKVDDPRVLEHIDAVFVTMEPSNGSPTPKGRRVLYASLAGAPNHP